MKSISLYVDKDTYLTRMHPFTKLCYILTAVAASLIAGKLWAFAIFIGISLVMLISGKIMKKVFPLVEDLEQAGFSPKIGYVISSVFQIVPQMSGTMNTIMDAQRSRGLETEGNLITRAKSFIPLISPVVMSSLINTRERAIALEIRGFEAGQKKTYLREGKMKTSDRVLCLVMAVVIAGAIVVRIVF